MRIWDRPYASIVATILLHPLPLDGWVWSEVAERGPGEVVVVPSLYDLGDSMGEWASAVLDLVPAGAHTIVGNSVGASCAAEIAHLAPDRVSRLVLVGGKLGHRPEPELRDEAIGVLVDQGLDSAWTRYWEPLFGPHADSDLIEAARRRAVSLSVDDVVRGVVAFHGRADRSDLCERWRGRLDVVCGEHDRAPSIAAASAAIHGGADRHLHVLDGMGHYVPLEAPDRLAALLWSEMRERARAR